jgi:hypothetical protein
MPSYLIVPFNKCNVFKTNPNNLFEGDSIGYYIPKKTVNKPEQWMVVEWALQVHKIFISVMPYDTITSEKEWTTTIFDMEWGDDKEIHFNKKIGGCKTKEEAYEKGISHFLTII